MMRSIPRIWLPASVRGALSTLLLGFIGGASAEPVAAGSRAADLESAKSEYVMQSGAFTAPAREGALRFIAETQSRADSLTPEQFLLSVLSIAAFADNGHDTENDHGAAWWPAGRLPLRMIWFPDGWVITRARSDYGDLLGARVISIDGHSSARMFDGLRQYWGGPDVSRRWNLEFLIENEGLLHAAELASRPDQLQFAVVTRLGSQVQRTVRFVPHAAAPAGQLVPRLWSPEPWPNERELGWSTFAAKSTPLYLEDGAHLFRVVPLPKSDALFMQMRVHFDRGGETVADFRDAVDRAVASTSPRNLVVDLRFDTGGNIDLTREWQRSLVHRIPGEIYVLVGPYTFSAGIVAAAAFKHDAGARTHVVGEDVGDRLRFWSEGREACMPASGYCLHVTTGLWDLVNGCASQPGCYGDAYDARVANLDPEIKAPLTLTDYRAGRDPAMIAVLRDIARRTARSADRR
jgi:hypothetical protein